MRLIKVVSTILCFTMCQKMVAPMLWIDQLTKHIAESPNYRLVNFVTTLGDKETIKSFTIEKLLNSLMRKVFTVRMDVGKDGKNFVDPEKLKVTDNSYIISATATFFILVHDPAQDSSEGLKTLIDIAPKLSAFHNRPKFLLFTKTPGPDGTFRSLLDYAWTKKLLDFTIVEFVDQRAMSMEWRKRAKARKPVIHQLNPFEKKYNRLAWNIDDLFPIKASDVHRQKLQAASIVVHPPAPHEGHHTPYEIVTSNQTISEVLNEALAASCLEFFPQEVLFFNNYKGEHSKRNHLNKLISGDLDAITFFLKPATWDKNYRLRTVPLGIKRSCAIVRKFMNNTTSINKQTFSAYCLVLAIILVYWLIARLLRFTSPTWKMFSIGRILFGISGEGVPTTYTERVAFISLVTVFAFFSGDICSAITQLSIDIKTEVLYESEHHSYFLNNAVIGEASFFDTHSGIPCWTSGGSITKIGHPGDFSFSDNDTICIISANSKKLADRMQNEFGRDIKIKEPCYLSTPESIFVNKVSPYRWVIDETIGRMQSVGFFDLNLCTIRPLRNKIKRVSPKKKNTSQGRLVRQLMYVLGSGLTLASIAFVIELMYHWTPRIQFYPSLRIYSTRQ